ncbi:MAG: peptide deformylase [Desulfobulbaceae bacterium]|nr:peptide deformylase [Desulfobulbaceae bacterium]
MALLKILTYPNPILRQQATPVTTFDDELKALVADMAETMYDAPGVGLAANQVGVLKQIVVIDITGSDAKEKDLIVLINPRITNGEGEETDEEGCLSVVEYTAKVKRFTKIQVEAQDIDGKPLNFTAEDFYARVIQHEVDHLNGHLFIDWISSLKRALYKKKRKKQLEAELKKKTPVV